MPPASPLAQQIARTIAIEINAQPAQVLAAIALLDAGSSVPFIARYRKEVTGGLDDTQLRNLETRLNYLRELEDRRNAPASCATRRGCRASCHCCARAIRQDNGPREQRIGRSLRAGARQRVKLPAVVGATSVAMRRHR